MYMPKIIILPSSGFPSLSNSLGSVFQWRFIKVLLALRVLRKTSESVKITFLKRYCIPVRDQLYSFDFIFVKREPALLIIGQ